MSKQYRPDRNPSISYEEILENDSNGVPDYLRQGPIPDQGVEPVKADRYYSKEFYDLERKHLWSRVWQHACHEDDIPEIGSCFLYEFAEYSVIVTRTENGIRAFRNVCLHRGRKLITGHCKKTEFECPFHAITWDNQGKLIRNPISWDLPHWDDENSRLPEAKVALWGGFVFINLDRDAAPFEEVAAPLIEQYERFDYPRRYRAFWIEKHVKANWKVAAEAFFESHHSQTTHPQILPTLADLNSQYDILSTYVSRQFSAGATTSPSVKEPLTEHEKIRYMQERGDRRVLGVDLDDLPDDLQARPFLAARAREALSERTGRDYSHVSDAEVLDALLGGIFPNMVFWAGYVSNLVYRWRPEPGNPEASIMDIMLMMPEVEGEPRPAPARPQVLGFDDKVTDAKFIDSLAIIFDQDFGNIPHVQTGLRGLESGVVHFGKYAEMRLRNLHQMIDRFIETGEDGKAPPAP